MLGVGASAALALMLPTSLMGVHLGAAVLGALALAVAVVLLVVALDRRQRARDPLAASRAEVWLAENPDDWPWWVFGGLVAAVGLLLLPSTPLVLPLVVLGGGVAALPWVGRRLGACSRVRAG